MDPESGDHFVEHQRRAVFLGDTPELVKELSRLQIQVTALDRLNQYCGQLRSALRKDLQGPGTAVLQRKDIAQSRRWNTGRDRQGPWLPVDRCGPPKHFVKDTVIVTRERRDAVPSGDRSSQTQRC